MAVVVVPDEVVVDHLWVDRGGRTVLSDITTTIPAGQVVGVLGVVSEVYLHPVDSAGEEAAVAAFPHPVWLVSRPEEPACG